LDLSLDSGATVEGFVRQDAQSDADIDLDNGSTVDGAIASYACGSHDVDIEESLVGGDLCVVAGEEADIGLAATTIEGDVKIDAPESEFERENATIEGSVNESWDSGWKLGGC